MDNPRLTAKHSFIMMGLFAGIAFCGWVIAHMPRPVEGIGYAVALVAGFMTALFFFQGMIRLLRENGRQEK
ncbi:hypothetical protein V3M68_03045 [Trueperella pyogenes]|uniref:hypothetical protein n=1 Tax=Trueperella pyogenes TaxID=1661 RepID=UPI00345DD81E